MATSAIPSTEQIIFSKTKKILSLIYTKLQTIIYLDTQTFAASIADLDSLIPKLMKEAITRVWDGLHHFEICKILNAPRATMIKTIVPMIRSGSLEFKRKTSPPAMMTPMLMMTSLEVKIMLACI